MAGWQTYDFGQVTSGMDVLLAIPLVEIPSQAECPSRQTPHRDYFEGLKRLQVKGENPLIHELTIDGDHTCSDQVIAVAHHPEISVRLAANAIPAIQASAQAVDRLLAGEASTASTPVLAPLRPADPAE